MELVTMIQISIILMLKNNWHCNTFFLPQNVLIRKTFSPHPYSPNIWLYVLSLDIYYICLHCILK